MAPLHIVIQFPRSRSPRFPTILALAETIASLDREALITYTSAYQLTVPCLNEPTARALLALTEALDNLRGVRITICDLLVSRYQMN